jgi:hypothetical protein
MERAMKCNIYTSTYDWARVVALRESAAVG